MPQTIQALIANAAAQIHSDSPRLDAELLLGRALDKPRSYFFSWPEKILPATDIAQFQALLARRIHGEPIAHILGEQEFWSYTFKVTADTLIPRPDTEVLVEQVLAQLPREKACKVADLGTGSGCIAISIALERPNWHVTAVDFSPAALSVAKGNADSLAAHNVQCIESSWCDALEDNHFDLIVSNPPYIREQDEHLAQGDVRFEPRSALTAGEDGLEDIRIISQQAKAKLKNGGILLLEFGYDQADLIRKILQQDAYINIQEHLDIAGIVRALSAHRAARIAL